jgi:hypothetical protein
VRQRLAAWTRSDARRVSCAVWTGRPGAGDQIGERSPLARLSNEAAGCGPFGTELERAHWLRAAVAEGP